MILQIISNLVVFATKTEFPPQYSDTTISTTLSVLHRSVYILNCVIYKSDPENAFKDLTIKLVSKNILCNYSLDKLLAYRCYKHQFARVNCTTFRHILLLIENKVLADNDMNLI